MENHSYFVNFHHLNGKSQSALVGSSKQEAHFAALRPFGCNCSPMEKKDLAILHAMRYNNNVFLCAHGETRERKGLIH